MDADIGTTKLTRLEDQMHHYLGGDKWELDTKEYQKYFNCLGFLARDRYIISSTRRVLTDKGNTIVKDNLADILDKEDLARVNGLLHRVRLVGPEKAEMDAAVYELIWIHWLTKDDEEQETIKERAKKIGLATYDLLFLGAVYTLNKSIDEGYIEIADSDIIKEGFHIRFTNKYKEYSDKLRQANKPS